MVRFSKAQSISDEASDGSTGSSNDRPSSEGHDRGDKGQRNKGHDAWDQVDELAGELGYEVDHLTYGQLWTRYGGFLKSQGETFGQLQLTVMNLMAKKPAKLEDISFYHRVTKFAEDSEVALAALETGVSSTAGQSVSAMTKLIVPKLDN